MSLHSRVLAFLSLAVISTTCSALPIPNPAPAALADDIDGSGYFSTADTIFSVEAADIFNATFGFYFQGSDVNQPSNLIPIFQPSDPTFNQAVVNFVSGIVIDVEDNAVQNIFSGTGNIGFFLTIDQFNLTLFSDPLLNAGNTDWMGTFPLLSDPSVYSLWFTGPQGLIATYNVNNLESVPSPATLLLLGAGLCSLLWNNRFHRRPYNFSFSS